MTCQNMEPPKFGRLAPSFLRSCRTAAAALAITAAGACLGEAENVMSSLESSVHLFMVTVAILCVCGSVDLSL